MSPLPTTSTTTILPNLSNPASILLLVLLAALLLLVPTLAYFLWVRRRPKSEVRCSGDMWIDEVKRPERVVNIREVWGR
jgi:hypothetical protein